MPTRPRENWPIHDKLRQGRHSPNIGIGHPWPDGTPPRICPRLPQPHLLRRKITVGIRRIQIETTLWILKPDNGQRHSARAGLLHVFAVENLDTLTQILNRVGGLRGERLD